MADIGHKETDDLLESLESRIEREYRQASEEVQEKLDKYLKQFSEDDKKHKALVDAGLLDKKDYLKWRKVQIMTGKRWTQMRDTLAADYANVNQIISKIEGEHLKDVYAINHNYGTYEIEHGTQIDTSYSLYDHSTVERLLRDNPKLIPDPGKRTAQKIAEGKLKKWNQKQIQSVMLQSILQGESIPHIAERLSRTVGEMDANAAIRTARTMTTEAESGGRVDSYKRAESMGIKMKQVWVATLDGRTRHEHRILDGQSRSVGEPFEVEGLEIMYPGDPSAPAHLVYNCRCTLIAAVAGTQLAEGLEGMERDNRLGDMSYEEWKEEKAKQGKQKDRQEKPYSTNGLTRPQRPRKSDFDNEDEYWDARERYKEERDQYEERLNQIIDNAIDYRRFESQDDVMKWAESQGIKITDGVFDSIDLRAFNETSVALDEMFKRFPEVFNSEYEDFDGNKFKPSFWIGLTDDGLLSANGGFNFNPSYFKDYREGLHSAFESQVDGYLVRGDGMFSSLVRHEYGHNVQSYIEEKIAQKYHANVDDWRKNYGTFNEYQEARKQYQEERRRYEDELRALAGLKGSSEYSNTNNLELFAEGFSEYASGGQSEFGKKFGEFLERWY